MKIFLCLIVITCLVNYIYINWRRPKICKRKINEYISNSGGQVYSIEKISRVEELYKIKYVLDKIDTESVVKFSFFYNIEWK